MSCGEYIMDTMDEENYSSHWEKCLKTGLFNRAEVERMYKRHIIDFDQYKYAMEYFAIQKGGFMNIKDLTDKELMQWYQQAVELRDGKYIKALKAEMNRRNKYQQEVI